MVPAIAAIITSLIFFKNIRDFGWRLGKIKYLIEAYIIPIIYAFIAYGIFWIVGVGTFTWNLPQNLILFVIIGSISTVIPVLGEEIGWRGFLVPQMAKITTFTQVGLITGVIWAVWHFPALIFGGYYADVPLWYALPLFTLLVIGSSFISAWFRLKSGSLWPVVLLHTSHNFYIQNLFDPLILNTGLTKYLVGETGTLLVGIVLIFAFMLWKMRDRLPKTMIRNISA